MKRPQGIILDCDGVLVDSNDAYYHCLIDIFAESGFKYTIEDVRPKWLGKPLSEVLQMVKNEHGFLPDGISSKFIETVPSYDRYVKVFPHAENSIKELSGLFKCAVGSNGERPHVDAHIDRLHLSDLFKGKVITPGGTLKAKPHPDIFLEDARILGLNPSECLVIEDSPTTGIPAAKAAGMKVIGFNGVLRSEKGERALINAGADVVFSDWNSMRNYITSLER